jgi:hypothetical protein
VLDYHTVSSTPTGDPYYRFDTKRTDLGEHLFRLKYRSGGNEVLADIIDTAADFLGQWRPTIDLCCRFAAVADSKDTAGGRNCSAVGCTNWHAGL